MTAECSPVEPAVIPTALRLSFAMLMLMLMLAALDQTIVSTALPSIARDLQGASRMWWVFSAYLIASTVAVPLYGRLADLHGSKPMLLAALALFLLGSVLCGVSRDMTELILARGLQGAGGGGLLTLAMMSVMRAFPEAARPRLQGLLGATYGLSTLAGPLVGGFLVEHLSWRWAFFINLPLGVLALTVLALKFPHRPPSQRGRLDHLGAALLGAALVSLLLSTQPEAEAVPVVPASLYAAVGLGLAALFVWVQTRVAHPLLPLSLFSQRAFSAATLLSAASGLMLFAVVVFMPLYFQMWRGLSPADSGLHLMPLMAGITVASMGCGRVLAATGRVRSTAIAACALATTAVAVLGFVVRDPGASLTVASACLVPLGMGIGALFPLVTVVAQSAAPMPLLGIATASPVMFRSVAGAVGVSLLAALFNRSMLAQIVPGTGLEVYVQMAQPGIALSHVLWAAAGVSVLASAAAWALPARLTRRTGGVSAGAVPARA